MLMIEKKCPMKQNIQPKKQTFCMPQSNLKIYPIYKNTASKNIIRITKIQTIWSKFILEFMRKYRIELKKIFVFSFYLSCFLSQFIELVLSFFLSQNSCVVYVIFSNAPGMLYVVVAVEKCWVDELNRLNPTNGDKKA